MMMMIIPNAPEKKEEENKHQWSQTTEQNERIFQIILFWPLNFLLLLLTHRQTDTEDINIRILIPH